MSTKFLKRLLALGLVVLLLCSALPIALADTATYSSEEVLSAAQITMDDLEKMNGDKLRYTTNSSGAITFLRGKFYEGTIQTEADVEKALDGMLELLGGDANMGFKKEGVIEDDNGYTYYTYYQWHGSTEVLGSVVKIIVDPYGKTVALSSSIMPGISAGTDTFITSSRALATVKEHLAQTNPKLRYTFYENKIEKTTVNLSGRLVLTYVIYTNNPDNSPEEMDLPYLAHYVTAEGDYLYAMPVFAMGDSFSKQGNDSERYFAGMTKLQYRGSVTLHDGSAKNISVPVMLDEDEGIFYLGDPDRKIALADCWEFVYNDQIVINSTNDNESWDDTALLAYDSYIKAYDYYNSVGWPSTDGLGTPILILTNYCDENHEPVDNACYVGKINGWQTFCSSKANNYAECLDVVGHEYTHGFTTASMTKILYENNYGAINESMSDIMGNLMEMISGATDDTTWQIGENSGEVIRCMTDPNAYGQPEYVGDEFYVPQTLTPVQQLNDFGGVHINNSLLCSMVPKLYQKGMTLEQERLLWTTMICSLVPRSDYQDVHEMLLFAADISGLSKYKADITKYYQELKIATYPAFKVIKGGCALVNIRPDEQFQKQENLVISFFLTNLDSQERTASWPSPDNLDPNIGVSLARAGDYICKTLVLDSETGEVKTFYYNGQGWDEDSNKAIPLTIKAGEKLDLTFNLP